MQNNSFTQKATSSEFLQKRIDINKNATNNFEHWSINTMPSIPIASNILDLGCGRGKQILSFSTFLSSRCSYYGCDISQESIEFIQETYSNDANLTLINDSFDNIDSFLTQDKKFNLIYSFYALYYTQDIKSLIQSIYSNLEVGGVFWVVMPYKNTNIEIFDILKDLYTIDEKVFYSINGFADDIIKISSEIGFEGLDISLFENKINFDTVDILLDYIQNTTFYNKEFAKEIQDSITKIFNNNFSLTKEVVSIKLTK